MGVLWLSLGVLFVPALGIVQSYSATGDYVEGLLSEGFNGALGVYLIGWGLALFVILICSMKTNITFIVLFAVLDAAFFVFAAAHFQVPYNPALATTLQKVYHSDARLTFRSAQPEHSSLLSSSSTFFVSRCSRRWVLAFVYPLEIYRLRLLPRIPSMTT